MFYSSDKITSVLKLLRYHNYKLTRCTWMNNINEICSSRGKNKIKNIQKSLTSALLCSGHHLDTDVCLRLAFYFFVISHFFHVILPQAKLLASTTKMPSKVSHLKTHEAHRRAKHHCFFFCST